MGFGSKFSSALSGGLNGIDVVFAWDGNFDCDLAFGLGANNYLQEAAYWETPVVASGAAVVHKDKKNGYGFGKSDESGSILLGRMPMHITEVAIAGLVQGGYRLGQVPSAEIIVFEQGTRNELARTDIDASFAQCVGGKIGEFQRVAGGNLWRWNPQLRGFHSLDEMDTALMQ